MILTIRAGAVPLVVLFKNSSLRANNVRFGLVIEKGRDLGQLLVIGFIRGRGSCYQLCLPPWVTGQRGVVVIERKQSFQPR